MVQLSSDRPLGCDNVVVTIQHYMYRIIYTLVNIKRAKPRIEIKQRLAANHEYGHTVLQIDCRH